MGLISSFQYFTQAYVFASVSQVGQSITGGPQNSLLFYSMYLYMNGFSYMKMGYASAMAIVLFLIVLVVSFVAMYLMEKRVTYDVESVSYTHLDVYKRQAHPTCALWPTPRAA